MPEKGDADPSDDAGQTSGTGPSDDAGQKSGSGETGDLTEPGGELADLLGQGMPDLNSLLETAQTMQHQLLEAQSELAGTVVEGQAGGGVVKVVLTGAMEFQEVSIDPSAVDPGDIEMLEDLVLAALHDATAKLHELQAAGPLGGIDIAGLGDLFGGDG